MGAGASLEDDNDSKNGYHVLSVKEGSPSADAGIEPFFDYIVVANGLRLDEQNATFFKMLKETIGNQLELTVFNSKSKQFRTVKLLPNSNWGGDGLLGCSIRFCNFSHAAEHVWHVMDVYPNSPASDAGLRPHTDYIIGTPDVIIKDKNDLFFLVDQSIGKPLRFYVYNWQTDKTREVAIIPDPSWGGEGALGCDIGFGYLHRIPNTKYKPVDMPQSRLKETHNRPESEQDDDDEPEKSQQNDQQKKKTGSNLMMEASASVTSLPDINNNNKNTNNNDKQKSNASVVEQQSFTNVDLLAKSRNASAVSVPLN